MKIMINILRHLAGEDDSFWQKIEYETDEKNETVHSALARINKLAEEGICDTEGRKVDAIMWESSCLQKKCGACAMVIDGEPKLACDAFLKDYDGTITIEPLKKFPIICDLIVDRSIMRENLQQMKIWLEDSVKIREKKIDDVYDSSRCLQCGLCLEVCPNFCPGDSFFGAAAIIPTTRLLSSIEPGKRDELRKLYRKHVYSGCGKSLACMDVCPAGIETDRLLSTSNFISMWKRK